MADKTKDTSRESASQVPTAQSLINNVSAAAGIPDGNPLTALANVGPAIKEAGGMIATVMLAIVLFTLGVLILIRKPAFNAARSAIQKKPGVSTALKAVA